MIIAFPPPKANGGSSTPTAIVYTWAAGGGTPASGHFTTDDASPGNTTHLKLHGTCKQGSQLADIFASGNLALYDTITLVSISTGKVIATEWIAANALGDPSEGQDVTVELIGTTNESAWSGDYAINLGPNTSTVSTSGAFNADEIVTFAGTGQQVKSSGSKTSDFATQAQGNIADEIGAVNGIVKSDGSANFSAASPGTDYITPATVQSLPDGSTAVTQAVNDISTKVATTEFVGVGFVPAAGSIANTSDLNADMIGALTVSFVQAASGIAPVADGTYGNITTTEGIVTAASAAVISGSFSGVGTATTTFTVTIGTTMANNTYKVNATPTVLLAAAVFYVNNKTTTTFDVVYLTGLTGTVAFDWAVFP